MPWLAFLQGFWSVISSRFGNICVAFLVAWAWSAHKTNAKWEAYVAAEKAAAEVAYQKELVRQAKVAQEIAKAATVRAEEDADLQAALKAQIEELKNSERPNVQTRTITRDRLITSGPCVIDADLAQRMRKLDATARQTRSARPARKIR